MNSHAAAAQIRYGGGGKAHRLFVVPNAVEDEVAGRAEARLRFAARWNADSRRLWIGSMGRLDADKRFHALLDIVASLTRRGYDLQLILIGYGDGLEALNEAARSLGIADRVVVSGPDPDARKWLSALDVFCFPSTDEGLPNAVMEAAVAGVPIVGWRTDFLAELLGGSGAALAEPGDRAGLEDAVARLLERPEERLQLGREARQRMSNQYGVNRLIERMTSVYEELLSPNGGGRP